MAMMDYDHCDDVGSFADRCGGVKKSKAAKDGAAFVTIDVQNEFCHVARGRMGWLVPDQIDINRSVRVIGRMLKCMRGQNVPVVHVRSHIAPEREYDFYRLQPEAGDIDIMKRSRSAFDEGMPGSGAFMAALSEQKIDTLVLSGFWLEQCVQATAESALRHAFRVAVVRDACSPLDYARRRLALDEMKEKGAEILRARDVLDFI